MSEKDERIKVMNEVLGGMKVHCSIQCIWTECNLLVHFCVHVHSAFW